MSIFILSNILANRQKKQTSDKYTHFQKTVLLFQMSQKITISKAIPYISRNYNQQSLSLHQPFSTSQKIMMGNPSQGKNHKKEKEKEKRKMKEKEKMKAKNKEKKRSKKKEKKRSKKNEKEKRSENEKRGKKSIMEEAGLKNIPSEEYRLRICSPFQFH